MISVGIAGCRRGRAYLRILKDAGFSLTCVVDPDANRRTEFANEARIAATQCFDRFEQLLDQLPDAVILASPMPNHVPQAVAALERGIHVLSEVPAAVNFDQCVRLRDAARASKASYMMAENAIYTREVQTVAAMAEAFQFGDLYYAEGQYLHDVRASTVDSRGTFTWRKRWQMDRRGCTYASHAIAPPLLWLRDRVVRVTAQGTGHRADARFDGDDSAVMLCDTAQGALVVVRTDLRSPRPTCPAYFQLQGTIGAYEAARSEWDHHRAYIQKSGVNPAWRKLAQYERQYLPTTWKAHARTAKRAKHGGADFFVLHAFARACRGEDAAVDVYTALDWTLPGLISELSVEQGGVPIGVPDPRTTELDELAVIERASGQFSDFLESV